MREDRIEKKRQKAEEREAASEGGSEGRSRRGRNHQVSVGEVWYNTCVQYGGRLLASFPDLYSVEVGETAG